MMASRCGFQEGGLQQKLQQYWQDRVKTKMPEDGMVFFSQGARFAVSRDRIHQRPREEYMDLLAEVSGARDPCVNYMNEWLWYYIMGRPQAAPCETPDIKMEAPRLNGSKVPERNCHRHHRWEHRHHRWEHRHHRWRGSHWHGQNDSRGP